MQPGACASTNQLTINSYLTINLIRSEKNDCYAGRLNYNTTQVNMYTLQIDHEFNLAWNSQTGSVIATMIICVSASHVFEVITYVAPCNNKQKHIWLLLTLHSVFHNYVLIEVLGLPRHVATSQS